MCFKCFSQFAQLNSTYWHKYNSRRTTECISSSSDVSKQVTSLICYCTNKKDQIASKTKTSNTLGLLHSNSQQHDQVESLNEQYLNSGNLTNSSQTSIETASLYTLEYLNSINPLVFFEQNRVTQAQLPRLPQSSTTNLTISETTSNIKPTSIAINNDLSYQNYPCDITTNTEAQLISTQTNCVTSIEVNLFKLHQLDLPTKEPNPLIKDLNPIKINCNNPVDPTNSTPSWSEIQQKQLRPELPELSKHLHILDINPTLDKNNLKDHSTSSLVNSNTISVHEEQDFLAQLEQTQLAILKTRCEAKLYSLMNRYRSVFKDTLPEPILSYDLRSRTIAGLAVYPNRIRLNTKFLLQEKDHYIDNVVGHELAHFIIFHKIQTKQLTRRVKPHGKEWKDIMRFLGIEPNIYHSYDTEKSPQQQFRYTCECDEHFLTRRRYNKIAAGASYRCRKCKAILTYNPLPNST